MNATNIFISCLFVLAIATLALTSNVQQQQQQPSENQESAEAVSQHEFNYNPAIADSQLLPLAGGPYQQHLQKKWSRLEPSIRFFKRSQQQQQFSGYDFANQQPNYDFANRYMLL